MFFVVLFFYTMAVHIIRFEGVGGCGTAEIAEVTLGFILLKMYHLGKHTTILIVDEASELVLFC